MREMLTLHCPLQETDESVRRERFLTERLLIPEQWIHEAKATRARRDGDRHQEALHLYRARYWSQCHRLLITHLASGPQTLKDSVYPVLMNNTKKGSVSTGFRFHVHMDQCRVSNCQEMSHLNSVCRNQVFLVMKIICVKEKSVGFCRKRCVFLI